MITVYSQRKVIGTDRYDYDLKGLSTDEKPSEIYGIEIVENSIFFEVDTGDFYYLKSQATESKETILEEQSFEPIFIVDGRFRADIGSVTVTDNPVHIVYDGVDYICSPTITDDGTYTYYFYGAIGGDDWSVYPFWLMYEHYYATSPEYDRVTIETQTGGEHTIEIYTESSTPTVWEKIGGGSSGGSSVVGTAVVGTAVVGG